MISPEAMQRMKAKVQERVTTTPPATWGKLGFGVLAGGLAIGWLAFPFVLDKVVASQINLAQGKDSRKLWLQLPPFDCNIYLFNITNPAQVMKGAKPVVQEIGPYCYKEVKDKTNLVEDPTADTISYSARTTWYEDQTGPGCAAPHLTGDEILVVPNIPILAILLIAEKDFPIPFMTLVNQALPIIFGPMNDLFMRISARQLLFGGIPINCTAGDLLPRAVCIALQQNSRALKKLGRNLYSFSYFGAKNHTVEEFRYTVQRGTQDGQAVGRLVALDGRPELPFWRGECNQIQGTDGTVFPPFRKQENGSLTAYSSEVCRVFFGIFDGKINYKGVEGYAYSFSMGNTESNEGERCFCPADDRCRKKGVMDLIKCQGAPLFASHPHFYDASPDYVYGVDGLAPEKEKHGIVVVLEPISGTPLIVRKRIQFNIEMKQIRYVTVSRRLRRTLVPLFWAEEKLDLDGELMGLLEGSLFLPIRAVDAIKWMCVIAGVGLGVAAAVLKYRKVKRDKVHVLNREIEQDYGHKTDPKPVLKFVEGDENENTHPFYIGQDATAQKMIENGLSAVALMKSASTMTSPHGFPIGNEIEADIKKAGRKQSFMNGDIREMDERNETVSSISFLSQNHFRRTSTETSFTPGNLNSLGVDQLVLKEKKIESSPKNSIKSLRKSKSVDFVEPDLDVFESSGQNILSSTEHQISPAELSLATYDFPRNSYFLPGLKNEPLDQPKRFPKPFEVPNIDQIVPSMSSLSVKSSRVNSGNEINASTLFDEAELFGDIMSRRSTGDNSPKVNERKDFTVENENENNSFGTLNDEEKYKTTIDTNPPTQEELAAVEQEINKLMADMAELIPRKQNNQDIGSQ